MRWPQGKLLNFGCIRKGTKRYRKALRQCRRNGGFDNSELWNIDMTFGKFLITRNYVDLREYKEIIENWAFDVNDRADDILFIIEDQQEREKALERLKVESDNSCKKLAASIASNKSISSDCKNFLVPRLKVYKKKIHGYPTKYGSDENWKSFIDQVIGEIEQYKFESFFLNIRDFWD